MEAMRLLLCLVACILSRSLCDAQCSGEGIYNEQFSKCYYFFGSQESFSTAESACSALNGRLVTIHSAFEEAYVHGNIVEKLTTAADCWIGLSGKDGSWKWADGTTASYTNWGTGFPMDAATFPCGVISASTGKWYNVACNDGVFAYVCESTATPVTTTAVPKTTESLKGWTYNPDTNAYYKAVFDFGYDWTAYEALCVSEGAHLASIHSLEEGIFVHNLEIALNSNIKMVWIGLHADTTAPFAFTRFTDGTAVDYSNWGGYVPKEADYCVAIYANGEWESVRCSDSSYIRGGVCKR